MICLGVYSFVFGVAHGEPRDRIRVSRGRRAAHPHGFVEPADAEALYAVLPDSLEPPTRYASLTGQRKRNVFGLTWAQVEFDPDGGVVIRLAPTETKNGTGQVLAFAPGSPVATLLRAQHDRGRLDCPYVFHRRGRRICDFYTAWRKACIRIGGRSLTATTL
jgi:integrase